MTVAELISLLKQFPPDVDVNCTWESTCSEIEPENIYQHKDGTLMIDSDGNSYEAEFKAGDLPSAKGRWKYLP